MNFASAGCRPWRTLVMGASGLLLRVVVHGQAPATAPPHRPAPKDTLHADLNEVVVSASRVEESFLQSPVTVEKLNARAIRLSPAASFFDAIEGLKGVVKQIGKTSASATQLPGFCS